MLRWCHCIGKCVVGTVKSLCIQQNFVLKEFVIAGNCVYIVRLRVVKSLEQNFV